MLVIAEASRVVVENTMQRIAANHLVSISAQRLPENDPENDPEICNTCNARYPPVQPGEARVCDRCMFKQTQPDDDDVDNEGIRPWHKNVDQDKSSAHSSLKVPAPRFTKPNPISSGTKPAA